MLSRDKSPGVFDHILQLRFWRNLGRYIIKGCAVSRVQPHFGSVFLLRSPLDRVIPHREIHACTLALSIISQKFCTKRYAECACKLFQKRRKAGLAESTSTSDKIILYRKWINSDLIRISVTVIFNEEGINIVKILIPDQYLSCNSGMQAKVLRAKISPVTFAAIDPLTRGKNYKSFKERDTAAAGLFWTPYVYYI